MEYKKKQQETPVNSCTTSYKCPVIDFIFGLTIQYYRPLGGKVAP